MFNRGQPVDRRLTPGLDAILLGDGGELDSLGVINLLVALEEAVGEEFGTHVDILTVATGQNGAEVFATTNGLVKYLSSQVG